MEKGNAQAGAYATITRGGGMREKMNIHGRYDVRCYGKCGKMTLKWADGIDNVVTDVGANYLLDHGFGGAQNTTYYLGLISSVGYTGIPVVGDTMSSHASGGHVWVEAGNGSNYPLWSTPTSDARATIAWSAAASRSKAISSAASFVIAGTGGTVKGCFIVTGTGAVATNNDTNGTLYSAGVFTGGDKVVSVGDTLNVSYSTSV